MCCGSTKPYAESAQDQVLVRGCESATWTGAPVGWADPLRIGEEYSE
jgi:hypothetical protein